MAKNDSKLKHSQGGVTTRDDATDLGVPMVQGNADEVTGPEDALGVGPKRGDYSDRIGPANYQPHEAVRQDDGTVKVEAQRPRVEDRGDAPGKGGVASK